MFVGHFKVYEPDNADWNIVLQRVIVSLCFLNYISLCVKRLEAG